MEKLTLGEWREIKGLSQQELANKAKISIKCILNYEKDLQKLRNASYSTVRQIAISLGIKTGQIFLGGTSEKPNIYREE